MIARIWRGRVRPELLDEYRSYIEGTGLRDYAATPGNRGAYMLTRQGERYGEVITLSFWESESSIAAFAGNDITRARYYPEDERFLIDFPERVEHFETLGGSVESISPMNPYPGKSNVISLG